MLGIGQIFVCVKVQILKNDISLWQHCHSETTLFTHTHLPPHSTVSDGDGGSLLEVGARVLTNGDPDEHHCAVANLILRGTNVSSIR